MDYLLGIDIGSTSIKSIIYNQEGQIISSSFSSDQLAYRDKSNPNWSYLNPDEVWNTTAAVVKESILKMGKEKKIKGISVTGLGAEGLPLDKDGNWLFPVIFFDKRTDLIVDKFKREFGARDYFSITGKQILPIDTLMRIKWVQQHFPEVFSKTNKWLVLVDYINYKFCGKMATDFSMASCTGIFDLKKGNWSNEILEFSNISKEILPEILHSGSILGHIEKEVADLTGLSLGTPIILGGHDFHCATLSSGNISPNEIIDIVGTWEIIITIRKKLNINNEIFKAGLAVERTVLKKLFTMMGSNVACDILEWFREHFGLEEKILAEKNNKNEWDYLCEKAGKVKAGSNGAIFLPHFFGSNSPIIDNSSLGAVLGLNRNVGKHEILRSLIEGLNYQFRDMLEVIELINGMNIKTVTAVGGATRNKLLMQNKADISGKVINALDLAEATALGAAILAGIGVGIYKNVENALRKIKIEKTSYYPDEKLKVSYNEFFKIYKNIYPNIKNINEEIHKKVLLEG